MFIKATDLGVLETVSFLSPCFRNVFKIQDTYTICVYTYTHIYKILMLLYTCVCV